MSQTPYAAAVLRQAALEPCVGRPGSRAIAERMVRADPAFYGLGAADVRPVPLYVSVPVAQRPVPAKSAPANPRNACATIRAWVAANLAATRAECEAAHPGYNPTTVRVQYAKAHKDLTP